MTGGDFCARHCGLSADDEKTMLRFLGLENLDDLARALPSDIVAAPESFDAPLSESEAHEELRRYAADNDSGKTSMIGLGYYGAQMPAALRRNLLENPAWYTAYTPYQAEISQGRLELLYRFQTMCAELTGLPMANASLLDEATAAAEAMTLLHRKGGGDVFLADESLFPQTLAVLRTRALPLGIKLRVLPPSMMVENCAGAFGALIGYPGGDGNIADWRQITAALKKNNIAAACATDLMALMLLTPPGAMGFDIAFGNSQRFGLPMGCGGPHAAFFAFAADYLRYAPGRVVGKSRDTQGRDGYRLALQTREQHIRREKATSNICTAQALPAMLAAGYAIYQGAERLTASAMRIHTNTASLAQGLQKAGRKIRHRHFFDTLRVVADDAGEVVKRAAANGVNLLQLPGEVGISTDDTTKPEHLRIVMEAFGGGGITINPQASAIPPQLKRQPPFSGGAVFCRSEHDMTRYLRQLAD
ncbi:MAG: glycine dehydrogenase (aminomethyl-transferring), partial [Gammaproteobacteria bacterium]